MTENTYRANEVVSCVDEGEDGALLYNPDKDDSVLLNATGCKVWAFLVSPHTLTEIAGHLTASYPSVAPEQATQDAEKFIQSLQPDFILASGETADERR